MAKRKTGDLLWLALRFAIQDRITLADAYDNDISESAVLDAQADVRAFRALQIKLFGTDKSELDTMIKKLQPRNIFAMLNDEIDDAEQYLHLTAAGVESADEGNNSGGR